MFHLESIMKLITSSRCLPLVLAAVAGIALGGCTMQDRPYERSSQGISTPAAGAASTPAMQPDRYSGRYSDRPRSFRDPGPMYPDTGN